jgi:hypothetical protein
MAKGKAKFARFVVRKDGGLMLGKSFGGLLKPNRVYQIDTVLDELIIRDMGPSCIDTGVPEVTWNRTANDLVTNGHHLHTVEEYKILCERGKR